MKKMFFLIALSFFTYNHINAAIECISLNQNRLNFSDNSTCQRAEEVLVYTHVGSRTGYTTESRNVSIVRCANKKLEIRPEATYLCKISSNLDTDYFFAYERQDQPYSFTLITPNVLQDKVGSKNLENSPLKIFSENKLRPLDKKIRRKFRVDSYPSIKSYYIESWPRDKSGQ